jgi:hypothetical protein
MRQTFEIPLPQVVPTEGALLRALGSPHDRAPGERVERLLGEALEEFRALAQARAIVADVGANEFAAIYEGAGDNEVPSPLPEILPRADHLLLFAATVGAAAPDRILALFDEGQPALAVTLDAVASEGAELAGVWLDHAVLADARKEGTADEATRILRYSPGYCGWNVTGQRALFAALGPEAIGIRLTESCLMEPVKSISGVMVVGPAEIHDFANDYGFCSECRTKDCRLRIRRLRSSK